MKLGIAVVYMASPPQRRLLEIHFDFIARHTTVPYAIYGGINRLNPELRDFVRSQPNFQKAWLPDSPYISGQQHASDLDALLSRAAADGATHLAVLHVDSWPVRPDWVQWIDARLSDGCVVGGALRAENGDKLLPSTCGLLFRRAFYDEYKPRFLLTDELLASSEMRRFQRAVPQTTDSGLSFGHLIWSRGLDWVALRRSNKHNDHYLMCGVYGDLFFHLGAAARKTHFHGDFAGAGATAQRRRIKGVKQWIKHRAPPFVGRWYARLRPQGRGWAGQIQENQRVFETLRDKLYADPAGYIDQLRLGAAQPAAIREPSSAPQCCTDAVIAGHYARSTAST